MKKSIIFLSFIFISLITNAQTTVFNFKPGLNLNGLTVGSSFDFGDINIGVSYFSTLSIYENNQPGFTPYSRETKLSLILPTIGFKLNVINQEDLRGYFGIALIKPIIIGSFEENGTIDPQFEEELKKTKMFSYQLSYGMEYRLSKSFSIGAEYGWIQGFYSKDADFRLNKNRIGIFISNLSLNYYLSKSEKE